MVTAVMSSVQPRAPCCKDKQVFVLGRVSIYFISYQKYITGVSEASDHC